MLATDDALRTPCDEPAGCGARLQDKNTPAAGVGEHGDGEPGHCHLLREAIGCYRHERPTLTVKK
jgi:hypothetical protein